MKVILPKNWIKKTIKNQKKQLKKLTKFLQSEVKNS